MPAGGGAPRKVSLGFNYCTEPDWSPDGKRLVFTARAGGSMVMAVHELATGRTVQLRGGEDPTWGADSRHIVFTSGGALYRLDTETGSASRLLPDMSGISEPSWSP
jgi:TolB protein